MKNLGYDSKTNHKFAILHDNGPDGQVVGGKLGPQTAAKYGYKVVMNQSFPTDATQFGSLVQQAKSTGADVVFVDAVTPQAIAIRKQMKAAGFTPKVLIMEKGGEPVQFAQALGKLSDGVLVGGYWDPSLPYPGAKTLSQEFEKETGNTSSQHIADSTTAAQVLLDAIARAGTTDKQKVNDAIAKTDKTYVAGPIKFGPDHTAKLALVEDQWQNIKAVVVGPTKDVQTGQFMFPVP
jgi:branched-chain amino acid transport system substrate-binding protein